MSQAETWEPVFLGLQVQDYIIGECIGEGAFGVVFEVARGGSSSAVKIITQPAAWTDFEREVRYLEKARGSSNVSSVEVGGVLKVELNTGAPLNRPVPLNFPYVIMQLAEGSLRSFIDGGGLDWGKRLRLWRSAIKGVHQLHSLSIAHRDLKADNILLTKGRSPRECLITDLGRARDWSESPLPGMDYATTRGDKRFAAPELLWHQGRDSPQDFIACDLYGLGSLLYEMTLGGALTAAALGFGPRVEAEAAQLLARGQSYDLSALRAAYEPYFNAFEEVTPTVIRRDLGNLLRSLCDPDPARRLSMRTRGALAGGGDLLPLLTRVDTLHKALSNSTRDRRKALAKA